MKALVFGVVCCLVALMFTQAEGIKRRTVGCPPPSRRVCPAGESSTDDCSKYKPCPGCFLCCQHPCAMRCYDPITQHFYRYPQIDFS
ncbi:whey acidic protein-like [Actinia tenebrosa]|uniref:Whey acidic protein-like n=1 Tax=Actinia tenebrosa TaxID=6105 RepID=A0A6P8IK81_ACTTE|nr:whey acidic protein-like [Actinia tenebrosa]